MKGFSLGAIFFATASATFAQQSITFETVSTPRPTDSLVFRTPLPDFEVHDLAGRRWRSADLRDKFTVVQIWSTSCAPCREEHPALQRFFDETRAMKNVQVLTFALDADPNTVRRYLKEKGYTFQVVVDQELEPRLFPAAGGIPKTFVIGPDGRRSDAFQSWTFGRILMELEKLAKAN
jgi:thiol-disulfide isomerase/thioredoxin